MELQFSNAISPYQEMCYYEALCDMEKASYKKIAELFREYNESLPSRVFFHLENHGRTFFEGETSNYWERVDEFFKKQFEDNQDDFSVCVKGSFQYPERLKDASNPIPLFYYKGDIGLLESRCISIVGARSCSEEGKRRAAKLACGLVDNGFTIVSGLALGVDTAALEAAIQYKGKTIGVIGTPINQYYPKENIKLQNEIAKHHLLISQVPFYYYEHQPFQSKRNYFPARNATMSAISEATVIVEASEKSGTLTQARECLRQGRKLFILNSCFDNRNITWPKMYEEKGAFRVKDLNDILSELGSNDTKLEKN